MWTFQASIKGSTGATGATGPQGDQGPAGVNQVTTRTTTFNITAQGSGAAVASTEATVNCPSGMVAISGGYSSSVTTDDGPHIYINAPTASNAGWRVRGHANNAAAVVTVYVICATGTYVP